MRTTEDAGLNAKGARPAGRAPSSSAWGAEHIKRFGKYSTHELGITPDACDAHLDVDFSVLGDDQKAAAA
ncbi:hypothetical protein OG905_01525 [Streptomyces sp. NBC_00322]|uniref:hypothetical protein n=1 Tax=Streptomyces sp. NBC_00322 TaxID=2975712 RepID=UPI002E2864E0|nr:hypothetical protein [Streptomyces sp. NBC_00322]